jgi:hypothetical protein
MYRIELSHKEFGIVSTVILLQELQGSTPSKGKIHINLSETLIHPTDYYLPVCNAV